MIDTIANEIARTLLAYVACVFILMGFGRFIVMLYSDFDEFSRKTSGKAARQVWTGITILIVIGIASLMPDVMKN